MERDSTLVSQPLTRQGVRKNRKNGGTKSGTLCESPVENPEILEFLDIVSAWASLPSNIRAAIVLLVQQHVQ
jgi:hypothetical protein